MSGTAKNATGGSATVRRKSTKRGTVKVNRTLQFLQSHAVPKQDDMKFRKSPTFSWPKLANKQDALHREMKASLQSKDLDQLRKAISLGQIGDGVHEVFDTTTIRKLEKQMRFVYMAKFDAAISKGDLEALQNLYEDAKAESGISVPTEAVQAVLELAQATQEAEGNKEQLGRALRKVVNAGVTRSKFLDDGYAMLTEDGKVSHALQAAMKSQHHLELKHALEEARAAGVGSQLLTLAEAVQAKQGQKLIKALRCAMDHGTPEELRRALAACQTRLGDESHDEHELIIEAERTLATEEKKVAAIDELREAFEERSLGKLRIAISRLYENGAHQGHNSDPALKAQAEAVLKKGEQQLSEALLNAVTYRRLPLLEKAIAAAKAVNEQVGPGPHVKHLASIAAAEAVKAEEHNKRMAREGLTAAMEDGRLQVLVEAINNAEAAQVERGPYRDSGLLKDAKLRMSVEELRRDSREALHSAVQSRQLPALKQALATALVAQVGEGPHGEPGLLDAARAVLFEEERTLAAMQQLTHAISTRSIEDLEAALPEGKEAGVERDAPGLISLGQAALDEEKQKLRAREQLKEAMKDGRIEVLRKALVQADAVDIDSGPQADAVMRISAQAALDKEERRRWAREELRAAISSRHMRMLREAISKGQDVDIDAGPHADAEALLVKAEEILTEEERKVEHRQYLHDATEAGQIDALLTAIARAIAAEVGTGPHAEPALLLQADAALMAAEQQCMAKHQLMQAMADRRYWLMRRSLEESRSAQGNKEPFRRRASMTTFELMFESEHRRMKARQDLHAVMEGRRKVWPRREFAEGKAQTILALEKAIRAGKAAGVEDKTSPNSEPGLIPEAEAVMEEEQKRLDNFTAAQEELRSAQLTRNIKELRDAISKATSAAVDAGLEAGEGFHELEAKQLLAAEEQKLCNRFHAAWEKGRLQELTAVIEDGKKVDMSTWPNAEHVTLLLKASESAAAEERKLRAIQKMTLAITSRDLQKLQEAISQGKEASVETGLLDGEGLQASIDAAGLIVEDLKRRRRARENLGSAMEQESEQVLQEAVEEYQAADADADADAIAGLLERAQALLNVRLDLNAAMRSLKYQVLLKSIEAARSCGETPSLLAKSEAVLKALNTIRFRMPNEVNSALQGCEDLGVQAGVIEAIRKELKALEEAYEYATSVRKDARAIMTKLKYDYGSKAFLCSLLWKSNAELVMKLKCVGRAADGLPSKTTSVRDDGFTVDRTKPRNGRIDYDLSESQSLGIHLESISSPVALADGTYTVTVTCSKASTGKEEQSFSLLLQMGQTLWCSGNMTVAPQTPKNVVEVLFFVIDGVICFDRVEEAPPAPARKPQARTKAKSDDAMSELSSAISTFSSK
mmetsp:Transcript_22676/g.41030  ORF Transcript_22676/g.41030 Transcript_22676/m.41030 type:complete len:1375 (+) Transcript_22676:110-4234(+)